MPAPAYTESEAAVHELGHAAVAWALALDIERVDIIAHPHGGWRGHCRPAANFPTNRRITLDAFLLGGPFGQLLLAPVSLGNDLNVFAPSFFTNTPLLMQNGGVVDRLRWGDDLVTTLILQLAPNSPHRINWENLYGAKSWLTDLEVHLRTFFADGTVVGFVNELQPALAANKQLLPAVIQDVFCRRVPPGVCQSLKDFVAAHPDVPGPQWHTIQPLPATGP